jgi:hypothetical protein
VEGPFRLKDVRIWDLVVFLVKLGIAAIPASLVLGILYVALGALMYAIVPMNLPFRPTESIDQQPRTGAPVAQDERATACAAAAAHLQGEERIAFLADCLKPRY